MRPSLTPSEIITLLLDKSKGAILFGPSAKKSYHSPSECGEKNKDQYTWVILSDIHLKDADFFRMSVLTGAGQLRTEYHFEAKFGVPTSSNSYVLRLCRTSTGNKEVSYQVAEVRSTKFPGFVGRKQMRVVLDTTFRSFKLDFAVQNLMEPRKKSTPVVEEEVEEEFLGLPKIREKREREDSEIVLSSSESEPSSVSPPRKARKEDNSPPIGPVKIRRPPTKEVVVEKPEEVAAPEVDLTKRYKQLYLQHLASGYAEEVEKKVREDLYFDATLKAKKLKVTIFIDEI